LLTRTKEGLALLEGRERPSGGTRSGVSLEGGEGKWIQRKNAGKRKGEIPLGLREVFLWEGGKGSQRGEKILTKSVRGIFAGGLVLSSGTVQ